MLLFCSFINTTIFTMFFLTLIDGFRSFGTHFIWAVCWLENYFRRQHCNTAFQRMQIPIWPNSLFQDYGHPTQNAMNFWLQKILSEVSNITTASWITTVQSEQTSSKLRLLSFGKSIAYLRFQGITLQILISFQGANAVKYIT